MKQTESTSTLGNGSKSIGEVGCTLTTFVRMANELGANVTLDQANQYAVDNNLYTADTDGSLTALTPKNGAALVNGLLGDRKIEVIFDGSAYGDTTQLSSAINAKENEGAQYFATARIDTGNKERTETYTHSVSINNRSTFFSGVLSDISKALGFKYNDTSRAGRTGTNDNSRVNNPVRVDFFRIEKKNWAMIENNQ